MCLVNPRHVVAIPTYDSSKIRVCEYIPIAEIERDEDGHWNQLESPFSEETYINYEKEELENLLQDLRNNSSNDSASKKNYIEQILAMRNKTV